MCVFRANGNASYSASRMQHQQQPNKARVKSEVRTSYGAAQQSDQVHIEGEAGVTSYIGASVRQSKQPRLDREVATSYTGTSVRQSKQPRLERDASTSYIGVSAHQSDQICAGIVGAKNSMCFFLGRAWQSGAGGW